MTGSSSFDSSSSVVKEMTHRCVFFGPTTLSIEETIGLLRLNAREIASRTQTRIHFDPEQNKLSIEAGDEAAMKLAKSELYAILWPEEPGNQLNNNNNNHQSKQQQMMIRNQQRIKAKRQRDWAKPDKPRPSSYERPTLQSKSRMTKIKISHEHLNRSIQLCRSLQEKWLNQLAVESHVTLDWKGETEVYVQGFESDQVQVFLDRLLAVVRMMLKPPRPLRVLCADVLNLDPNTYLHWPLFASGGSELVPKQRPKTVSMLPESVLSEAGKSLFENNISASITNFTNVLDGCRNYSGDVSLNLQLGRLLCCPTLNANHDMIGPQMMIMNPTKPNDWSLAKYLKFDEKIEIPVEDLAARFTRGFGVPPAHEPSLFRYELDLELPSTHLSHLPEFVKSAKNERTTIRLHLFPSSRVQEQQHVMAVDFVTLECRKVACSSLERLSLLWVVPGAAFDIKVSIETDRVLSQTGNPQLASSIRKIIDEIEILPDGTPYIGHLPATFLVHSVRKKKSWVWKNATHTTDHQLELIQIQEWQNFTKQNNRNTLVPQDSTLYNTVNLHNLRWRSIFAPQHMLPMGETAEWGVSEIIGPKGRAFVHWLMHLRDIDYNLY